MNKSTYLSPYEFTRIGNYMGGVPINQRMNPDDVASSILRESPNIRKTAEYQNTKSCYYDCTMSCDVGEAKSWLKAFMNMAMDYRRRTNNTDWRDKYLAAYDILKEFR